MCLSAWASFFPSHGSDWAWPLIRTQSPFPQKKRKDYPIWPNKSKCCSETHSHLRLRQSFDRIITNNYDPKRYRNYDPKRQRKNSYRRAATNGNSREASPSGLPGRPHLPHDPRRDVDRLHSPCQAQSVPISPALPVQVPLPVLSPFSSCPRLP